MCGIVVMKMKTGKAVGVDELSVKIVKAKQTSGNQEADETI